MDYENLKPIAIDIKVLGTGCSKCKSLEKLTRQIAEELQLDAAIEKIDDIQKIMDYGVMSPPALVINGKVVLSGRLPKNSELKEILSKKHN